MSKSSFNIREINPKDDVKVAKVIRTVLEELGAPNQGTAYADATLDSMTDAYRKPRSTYFVIESGSDILGGAGIAPLNNYKTTVCELQKMYFLPKARGQGLGQKMINQCLDFAKSVGFEHCYLETMPNMKRAQKLYAANGFDVLEAPLGSTGHFSCSVWMVKAL